MIRQDSVQSMMIAGLAIAFLFICAFVSYVLVAVMDLDLKWLVYIIGGLLGGLFFATIVDKERFLWTILVIGFQFDVYIRLLYGHSGSSGLGFGLPFVAALGIVIWFLAPATRSKLQSISFGGPLGLPIAAIFVTSIISTALSSEQFIGLGAVVNLAQFYLFFLLALNYIDSEEKLEYTIKLLLVVLTMQSIVYFIQIGLGITFTLTGEVMDATGRSSGAARPGGTVATSPAGFAGFMLPLVCIASALYFWVRPNLGGFIRTGLPALLGLTAIILSLTRAAWGSMAIGLAVIIFLSYRRGLISQSKFLLVGIFGFIIVIAALPLIIGRLSDAPLDGSFNERVTLMKMALELIKAEPVFGVGPSAYRSSLSSYLPYDMLYAWRTVVHNHYLLRTAETGILGGISFIIFLLAAGRQAYRVSRFSDGFVQAVGIGIFGGLAALLFEMFWDMWTGYSYNALMWFIFGLLGAAERLNSHRPSDPGTS